MAELCKSCIHTKVCMKDKNIVGDVFVPGNPMIFDNAKLFAEYEERKKAGFPCDDYMPADASTERHGRWNYETETEMFQCSVCKGMAVRNDYPYCHWCGTLMDLEVAAW